MTPGQERISINEPLCDSGISAGSASWSVAGVPRLGCRSGPLLRATGILGALVASAMVFRLLSQLGSVGGMCDYLGAAKGTCGPRDGYLAVIGGTGRASVAGKRRPHRG